MRDIFTQKKDAILYRLLERYPTYFLGTLQKNRVEAYWYRDHVNFGDLLTPYFLKSSGFTPVHSYKNNAQLISVGSVLEHVSKDFEGKIFGSGFISKDSSVEFLKSKIYAVRGIHTKSQIGSQAKNAVLGDPGLLCKKLLTTRQAKKYAFGIIPHHSVISPAYLKPLLSSGAGNVVVISPKADPISVITAIDQCERILSSSMHGLIISDALNIPSVWVGLPSLLGGNFKFFDYASAVNRKNWKPHSLTGQESFKELEIMCTMAPIDDVAKTVQRLSDSYDQLIADLRQGS